MVPREWGQGGMTGQSIQDAILPAASHPLVSWPLATSAAVTVGLVLAWRPVAARLDKVITPLP